MKTLSESLQDRILLLDGAMGSLIQTYSLVEKDFRGNLDLPEGTNVQGNNDLLSLTRPDIISDIHRRYLEAGADIITANTFSSQRVSQAEYHCGHLVKQLNIESVRIAKGQAEAFSTTEKPRYVIATIGPTSKSLSISPDVNDPAFRAITYDELYDAYREQACALLEAGVDGILVETVFDTLNAKAAMDAIETAMQERDIRVPMMLSITVNDRFGRILSGQTLEALLASVSHFSLLSIGLNCSFGAEDMLPSLRTLAAKAPYFISAHPNAGLPNAMGQYDQSPSMMAAQMEHFVSEGLVNIIGGCCGTTPEHIAALLPLTTKGTPHIPIAKEALGYSIQLSGLEPLITKDDDTVFVNVGERCNVAGSRKFLRLIKEKAYEEALEIARQQVLDGAMVLDLNMDDGMLDTRTEMCRFLHLIGSEPEISKVPLMIDSSNWEVISEALKCVQGKCIVNSFSLKEGEDLFLLKATLDVTTGTGLVLSDVGKQALNAAEGSVVNTVQNGANPTHIALNPANAGGLSLRLGEHKIDVLDAMLEGALLHGAVTLGVGNDGHHLGMREDVLLILGISVKNIVLHRLFLLVIFIFVVKLLSLVIRLFNHIIIVIKIIIEFIFEIF